VYIEALDTLACIGDLIDIKGGALCKPLSGLIDSSGTI
jgi:hypothetical protein